jgi:hypothetical protein
MLSMAVEFTEEDNPALGVSARKMPLAIYK